MSSMTLFVPDRFSRDKRKEQVIDAFQRWNKSQPGTKATMRKIARVLRIGPSTYLMDMLWEMVEEGKLAQEWSEHPNGWQKSEFSLPDGD